MNKLSKESKDYLRKLIKTYRLHKKIVQKNNKMNKIWQSFFQNKRKEPSERDYLNTFYIYITPFNIRSFNNSISWYKDYVKTQKSTLLNAFINRKNAVRLSELIDNKYVRVEIQPISLYKIKINRKIRYPKKEDDDYFKILEDMYKNKKIKEVSVFYLTKDGLHYFNFFRWIKRNISILTLIISFLALAATILVGILVPLFLKK